jgi:hypothetical protein
MKVKIGNQITTLTKDVVICHMANLLSSRAIILRKETNFKLAFEKYKKLCSLFLNENKKFVYTFGTDDWLENFLLFEINLNELLVQDVSFQFSDKSTWSVSLNDIANLRIVIEENKKHDKMKLLENPIELIEWAQLNLGWYQIKPLATLTNFESENDTHEKEWPSVIKKIQKKNYKLSK